MSGKDTRTETREQTTARQSDCAANNATIDLAHAINEARASGFTVEQVAALYAGYSRPETTTGKHSWGDDDPDTPLTPAKIADRLGIPPTDRNKREALRKRLEKWRGKSPKDGWIEDEQGGGRKVKYSYRIGKVWPVVEDMKHSG